MTATGRKKLDELYHPVIDRSEFYAMSDLQKPPVLFSPAEDIEKVIDWFSVKINQFIIIYFRFPRSAWNGFTKLLWA